MLAKPAGPTSHDMVALVRRLSGTKRVGHGGTLDPFAAGVLPIFLGRATRVAEYHLGDRKAYRATVCFGASSTTDDLEGELTPSAGAPLTRERLEAAMRGFLGEIEQRPPAYSALKVGGRRAYALARAGEKVELAPRRVTIHRLELLDWDDSDPARPTAVIDVGCSAGTYIRALARDLGESVGSAAYLGALERTASGPFRLADSVRLDTVRAAAADGPAALEGLLRPIDWGLDDMPSRTLSADEVAAVSRGQLIRAIGAIPTGATHVRLVDASGRLVAIAAPRAGRLLPDKVLVDAARPSAAEAVAAEGDPPTEVDSDPASADD